MRSLEVGAPYYHVHPLNDHPGYSNDYLNRISWQTDDTFRSPIGDPRQMFDKIFGFAHELGKGANDTAIVLVVFQADGEDLVRVRDVIEDQAAADGADPA